MKRYGDIFNRITDMDNLTMAHENARKGKTWYKEVKIVDANIMGHMGDLHKMLISGDFKTAPYSIFTRKCGEKYREIYKLPYYPDRIVHHAILQVIGGLWTKSLIADSYACVKGRGIHKAAEKIKQILREDDDLYCLKLDIHKFYPSVHHDILKLIIRKKIKCARTLSLLDGIIDSTEDGIPIGNYLSQHLANIYLSPFDHWIKEIKRIKYYFRYSDDLVFLHPDKNILHALRVEAQEYLQTHLGLRINANWQVSPIKDRGLDFLGYKFYPGYTLVRKSIAKRFKAQIKNIKAGKMRGYRAISSVMSYYGWLKHANALNLINRYIDDDIQSIIFDQCSNLGIRNPLLGRVR